MTFSLTILLNEKISKIVKHLSCIIASPRDAD